MWPRFRSSEWKVYGRPTLKSRYKGTLYLAASATNVVDGEKTNTRSSERNQLRNLCANESPMSPTQLLDRSGKGRTENPKFSRLSSMESYWATLLKMWFGPLRQQRHSSQRRSIVPYCIFFSYRTWERCPAKMPDRIEFWKKGPMSGRKNITCSYTLSYANGLTGSGFR